MKRCFSSRQHKNELNVNNTINNDTVNAILQDNIEIESILSML
jgi:hypothetical protein